MPVGELLTTREVAKKLRVSVARISQFVTEDRLKPATRVGTTMLFEQEAIEQFARIPRRPGPPVKE